MPKSFCISWYRTEVRCNFDEFHGFPVIHFGDENLEEAGSNRTCRGQKDTCNTIRNFGDSCTYDIVGKQYYWCPHIHQHPTTHDFGDGKNLHGVFPAHFDYESNKEEVNIDELNGGERDARHTLRKLGDRLLDTPVMGTVKETF